MFKCYFRIKSKKSGKIDGGEQNVPDFFLGAAPVGNVERRSKLGNLFVHFVENSFDVLPIKTNLRGAAGQSDKLQVTLEGFAEFPQGRKETSGFDGELSLEPACFSSAFNCAQFFKTSLDVSALTSPNT